MGSTSSANRSIDHVLDQLPHKSVDRIAFQLQVFDNGSLTNQGEILILVKNIYDRAVSEKDLCLKYLELVKYLSGRLSVVPPYDSLSYVQVAFLKYCNEKYKVLFLMDQESRHRALVLYGQLFNADMVSGMVMYGWIVHPLNLGRLEDEIILLKTIKDKVISENKKPGCDRYIPYLIKMFGIST